MKCEVLTRKSPRSQSDFKFQLHSPYETVGLRWLRLGRELLVEVPVLCLIHVETIDVQVRSFSRM